LTSAPPLTATLLVQDAASALEHLAATPGLRFLLVGSYLAAGAASNSDITTGGYYPINLLAPPFSFPRPLDTFSETVTPHERTPAEYKSLLLFSAEDLASVSWADLRERIAVFKRRSAAGASKPKEWVWDEARGRWVCQAGVVALPAALCTAIARPAAPEYERAA
jgi:hypothetical protein